MKKINNALGRGLKNGGTVAIGILLACAAHKSEAQLYNLSAQDTSIQISLGGATPGISNWTIDGVNQLDYQWFYYSVGGSTVNSIDTIAPWSIPTLTTGNNPSLTENYANTTLSLTTKYILQSQPSGTGKAALATTITLQNVSNTTQTFHLYQYSDFDLENILGNQTVQFAGTGIPYRVTQSGTVGGPMVGTISAVGATVEELAGIEGTNLLGLFPGSPAPVYDDTSLSSGPGQVAYAYEIDETLNPNQSLIISELQSVPEPSTVALTISGMLVSGLFYGRKLASMKNNAKKTSL